MFLSKQTSRAVQRPSSQHVWPSGALGVLLAPRVAYFLGILILVLVRCLFYLG
ncbi:MAG: hypothetical protein M3619_18550 [Myxococcota bacterium]|nr:hypothetical protein [Myxococcota bacterium]